MKLIDTIKVTGNPNCSYNWYTSQKSYYTSLDDLYGHIDIDDIKDKVIKTDIKNYDQGNYTVDTYDGCCVAKLNKTIKPGNPHFAGIYIFDIYKIS